MGNLKNTPTLRFPEFTGEWEKKKLGEVAELTSSKRVYANDYVPYGIPFYRGKEITELKENKKPSDILYISNTAYEKFKETFGVPQINDLLITAVGTLGNVLTIKNNEPFYFKDGNLIWLRKVNQLSEFLEIILYFNFKAIEKSSIGSSQKALTMVELRKLSFLFPSLPEQQKIASFLTAVDDKLQALKKKKSHLDQYKKGVMQKIFSQELRFKDDDGLVYPEWELKELGTFAKIFDGTHQTPAYVDEGIPFYSVEHLTSNDFTKTKFVTQEVYEKENKRVKVEKGDILMTRIGDIGTSRYIDWDVNASFYVSIVLIKQSSSYISKYLHHFIGSNFFQNELYSRTIHVAFPKKINLGEIGNCLAYLPCMSEQTKIANFLTAIDEKIQLVQIQVEKMEVWKKGLLQKMFV